MLSLPKWEWYLVSLVVVSWITGEALQYINNKTVGPKDAMKLVWWVVIEGLAVSLQVGYSAPAK